MPDATLVAKRPLLDRGDQQCGAALAWVLRKTYGTPDLSRLDFISHREDEANRIDLIEEGLLGMGEQELERHLRMCRMKFPGQCDGWEQYQALACLLQEDTPATTDRSWKTAQEVERLSDELEAVRRSERAATAAKEAAERRVSELTIKLQNAESERTKAETLACTVISERDDARTKLQEAEKERDEARRQLDTEIDRLVDERIAEVRTERDEALVAQNRAEVLQTKAEEREQQATAAREAALQRVEELTTELGDVQDALAKAGKKAAGRQIPELAYPDELLGTSEGCKHFATNLNLLLTLVTKSQLVGWFSRSSGTFLDHLAEGRNTLDSFELSEFCTASKIRSRQLAELCSRRFKTMELKALFDLKK